MAGMGERSALRILALEPYYGGSHQVFVDSLIGHSKHRFDLLAMPARKWKWRMRGSAIWFAEELANHPIGNIDLIFANDMVSIADLRALLPRPMQACPVVCYFHENQLTYPLSEHDVRDYQYGFTNITSCLSSDEVWFNSHSHRDSFLSAAAQLLKKMPDYRPREVIDRIRQRSRVVWPLVGQPPAGGSRPAAHDFKRGGGPVILWSHRWEFDKNPELFFRTLIDLSERGLQFSLVLLGESFRRAPAVFGEAWDRLEAHITHSGFVESRDDYWRILAACDVVVSTAVQENFGLSMVEAVLAGCFPLLPNRLSYPELLPEEYHKTCLYDSEADFSRRLEVLIRTGPPDNDLAGRMGSQMATSACSSIYDNGLERVSTRSTASEDAPAGA